LSAGRRRFGDPFLTAEWRDLVMLNFEIDPSAIAGLAPSGTELDDWNGTTFISLVHNENYVALPMRHEIFQPLATSSPGRATYEWFYGGRWQQLSLRFSGSPILPAEDSQESFITEHYWGYARQRDGSTVEYQVEHPPWPVWRAEETTFEGDAAGLYGSQFASFLDAPPVSAFIAAGSSVTVRRGTRLV
jgi:hypothetical protein